ncbi:MAG: TonB-dependent receptor [Flavobacteriales bacterium]|nr:TonB-dependent receptor [Flavobacteriales bacterium]
MKDNKGLPLIGSTVYLEGTTIGASANVDGYYVIENIEPGTYNLVATFIGYESQTQYNIPVKSAGNQPYNFVLEENATGLDEVVVTAGESQISRSKENPVSVQTLSANEIATYPGGNNDVVRVAQSLPGVSPSVGGFRNDLIIRGGAPNESVYYLDGMEIPNINHFSTQGAGGGPVGLLNVSFIENVTLSASSFGAQYENPLSGVLQFEQREGNFRDYNANLRVSASETALTVNGPLFKNEKEESKTSFILSGRRSYLQFLFDLIGLPIRPDYYDYQYKITHKIDKYNTLNLLGVGSIDDFTVEPSDDFEPSAQSTFEQVPFIVQQSNAIGLSWRHLLKNERAFMTTTISNNFLDNQFSRYSDNENQEGRYFLNDAREMETKLRYAFNYFSNGWKWTTGFNLQRSDYENLTEDLNREFRYKTEIDFIKYGVFTNVTKSFFSNRFDVSAGVRADGDSFTEDNNLGQTISPRVGLSYSLTEKWKLNATIGRYFKIAPYTILGYQENGKFVNQNADYTESDHYVFGIERILGPASNITLEGFYKEYSDYPVSVRDSVSLANKGAGFEVLGNEAVKTVGRGRSYGVELLFQQKLTKNFYGIFSYTYFYSEFTGFDADEYLPSVWDSRHLVSFTGGYKLPKEWELSARWRFAGETPFVPVDTEISAITYPELVLDYQRLGEENLGAFSQLDVRIDKKWNFKNLSLNVFFEIQNLLAQQAPEPPSYVLATDMDGNIVQPQQLEELPTEDGSIIPTIGLVVDFGW